MIFDKLLTVATAQTLVGLGSAGTVTASTDRIPLSVFRDVGDGYPLALHIDIPEAATTDATRSVEFVVATTSDTGVTDLTYLAKSGVYVASFLTAGARIIVPVPAFTFARTAKYLFAGINVTADGGGDWTTGTATMRFVLGQHGHSGTKTYPASFTIT
jgi:hypothetical protein